MNLWISLVISGVTDFIISAGGCVTTAMVATGSTAMPSTATWIFAVITGAVAASRRLQALLQVPPK